MKRATMKLHPCEQTAYEVQQGNIHANETISRLLCQHRHERRIEPERDFPWTFDEATAQKAVDALARLKPALLESALVWVVYGWKSKSGNTRRYSTEGF